MARVLFLLLRPEQSKQLVPAVETPRACAGQVRQQGKPLRLLEYCTDLRTVVGAQIYRAQGTEANHSRLVLFGLGPEAGFQAVAARSSMARRYSGEAHKCNV